MPSTGAGRLWSFAAFHKSYLDGFHLSTPYVVAVIDLDEGVRLYGNVVGTPMSELRVDSPVHAQFITDRSGNTHLVFTMSEKDVR
ncbi:MAG: OB-fold domain-containing protein [Mycobacterium sp.]